ncbi:hypothetical protein C8R45DRAFT_1189224 [Mycena sanguinolenta]|nr:hypothetical protein C8R45DRAFT_1189224 [Mycena sanguinolenta]
MANTSSTDLPNPFTPLAFLSPAVAGQFEASRYLYAATLGAYTWDIGLNLGNDYALLFKHRVRFPTIVYFLSRAFTLALILSSFVFQVASVENCNALGIALGICFVLSQTATAMLFFLRVTAVWHPSKIAYVLFSMLWIAVLGAGITAPLGILIIPLVNDTAIFLAINYRILAHTMAANSLTAHLRVFFGGTGQSALSRASLQSGQHFYLIAVTHIVLLVLLKLPQFLPVYHAMPGFVLINVMACQVFRRINFGLISSDGTSKDPVTGRSVDFHATANPRTDPIIARLGSNPTSPLDVRVQMEIDKFEDEADARHEISKPADLV